MPYKIIILVFVVEKKRLSSNLSLFQDLSRIARNSRNLLAKEKKKEDRSFAEQKFEKLKVGTVEGGL